MLVTPVTTGKGKGQVSPIMVLTKELRQTALKSLTVFLKFKGISKSENLINYTSNTTHILLFQDEI